MATQPKSQILSAEPPTAVERAHDLTLDAWVTSCIEPKEESDRRRNVVDQLLTTCRAWIKYIMVTEFRLPATEDYGGKIFATGSYRHNVHSSGSDIDLVLFAPDRITRDHFFTSLVDRIRSSRGVTDLTFTPEAVVPIISFKCDGVDIDLAFVSIRSTHVPDNFDFLKDSIHIGLDEFAVRSVNGVRDAQLLLDLVPNQSVFRTALRFVKHWSKNRSIYGAKLGFTSGIGWAILVAKVCQLYPNQNGAGLLVKFFKFCKQWFRPDTPNSPIYITPDLTPPNIIPGVPKSWHPKNGRAESNALFPIITPAYPYQNSCYSVSRTTLETMLEEFTGALEFLTAHMESTAMEARAVAQEALRRLDAERALQQQQAASPKGGAIGTPQGTTGALPPPPPPSFGLWSTLLAPYNVFAHHQYFLHIAVPCTSAKEYDSWADFVEAKIRFLWFEGTVNKGAAFECYRSVKLRVCSQRFEDPQQKEELRALKEQAKASAMQARMMAPPAASKAASGLDDGMAGSPGGIANSPRRPLGVASPGGMPSTQLPVGGATAGAGALKVFTAHYYFGFALVNGPNGAKPVPPKMGEIKDAFLKICSGYTNRTQHTKDPIVEIVKLKDLPKWLPDLPSPTADTTAAPATSTTSAKPVSAAAVTSTSAPPAEPAAVTTERRLRMDEDESLQQPRRPQPPPAAAAPLASSAPVLAAAFTAPEPLKTSAVSAVSAAAADADEILGLDF